MAIEDFIIPVASILVPIGTLFFVRSLDKGEKKKTELEVNISDIHRFVETNKGLIAKLVEDIEGIDLRLRKTENDLNRIWGRMNGKGHNE